MTPVIFPLSPRPWKKKYFLSGMGHSRENIILHRKLHQSYKPIYIYIINIYIYIFYFGRKYFWFECHPQNSELRIRLYENIFVSVFRRPTLTWRDQFVKCVKVFKFLRTTFDTHFKRPKWFAPCRQTFCQIAINRKQTACIRANTVQYRYDHFFCIYFSFINYIRTKYYITHIM